MKTFTHAFLRKCVVFLMLIGLTSLATIAQSTITGTVSDADGFGLPGASVVLQGTTTGTITDVDGKYSLTVPGDGGVLVFSFIGFETIEMPIDGSKAMNVTLRDDSAVLDEIVVVGYGSLQQKEVTSAVASVKPKDFNQGAINNPLGQLQGKVAGVSISQNGSDPNGTPEIRLRGLSTLGANTQPLIVIDGVVGASLESIDPFDIASFDVLKDGSAAAIYGVRASSGVILITTKKGTAGKTKVEYNAQFMTESISKTVETMDASEFRTFRPGTDRGANTDWIDEVTDNSFSQAHGIALTGGIGNSGSYRASLNYRDIDGVAVNNGFERFNGRLSINQKALNDRLNASFVVGASSTDAARSLTEVLRYATVYNPTAPVLFDESDDDFATYGGYYQEVNFDFFNPVAIAEQIESTAKFRDVMFSGKLDFEIVDGLTVSAQYSKQVENDLGYEYYDKLSYFRGQNANGLARQFSGNFENNLFETTLNYGMDLDSGLGIDLLVGYSYQDLNNSTLNVQNGDFISDATTFNSLQGGQDLANGLAQINSNAGGYEVAGIFGRAIVNLNDYITITGALRRDGTSRNGPENRFGNFWGLSGGVDLGRMLDVASFDQLKLRAGYGITGSIAPSDNLFRDRFTQQGSFFFNGSYIPAYGPASNANPDLRFEEKGELNIGLDFALFNYLVKGSLDYYNRVIDDFLFQVNVPVPPNQAPFTWANLDDAQLNSSGFEAAVEFNFENNNMLWQPKIILATNTSEITRKTIADDAKFLFFNSEDATFFDPLTSPGAPGLNDAPTIAIQADQEVGNFWGPVYTGLDDAGQFVFEDLNGDGSTDANEDGLTDEEDKQIIGNGLPNLNLGFNNKFEFGDFDFNFFIRGDFGHDMVNMYRVFYEPLGTGSREIENIVKTQYFDENLADAPEFSSHYVEDADYVALDNVTLGYNLDVSKNDFFSKARVYISGNRLFYLTDYTGVDPSPIYSDPGASDNGGNASRFLSPSPLAPGLDRRNRYFRTRLFTFGLNLEF